MTDGEPSPPGLAELARKLVRTGALALANRGRLFQVELQEETNRVVELFIWAVAVCMLGMMFALVLTATVLLLVREGWRIYAAIGFCLLYLAGAVFALLNLKALVKEAPLPFSDTMAETKKDLEWFESLE